MKAHSNIEWNDAVEALHGAADVLNRKAGFEPTEKDRRYVVGNSLFNDTASMLPMLHNKCLWIEDHRAKWEDLAIGDIVVVRHHDGKGAIHNIVKKTSTGYFRTQGINNKSVDRERLRPDNFRTRIVAIIYTDGK